MKTYSDISTYIKNGNQTAWSLVYDRALAFPLEKYSIFNDFNSASSYAKTNDLAYEGQVIAVNNGNRQIIYVLDSSNDVSSTGLRRVGVVSADELYGMHFTYVKCYDDPILSDGVKTDLSVVKLDKETFVDIVAISSSLMSANCLYVVDSDYNDAYGMQLCNLTMSNIQGELFEGIATTKPYVDAMISATSAAIILSVDSISTSLNTVSTSLNTVKLDIANLCSELNTTSSDLSLSVQHKIWIKDGNDSRFETGDYSNLSIIKITLEEYYQKTIKDQLSGNILYVISSDYIEAYNLEIKNLSTFGYGIANAANMNCISALSSAMDNKSNIYLSSISGTTSFTGGKLDRLNIVKFDSLDTYELCSSYIGLSDLILIDEDNLNARMARVLSVADPISAYDGANKQYVDNHSYKFSKLLEDLTISSFISSVQSEAGIDGIQLEQVVSSLYNLINKLISG